MPDLNERENYESDADAWQLKNDKGSMPPKLRCYDQ